jgi:hypothetical protein
MYKHDFTDNCGFDCVGNKGLFHVKTADLFLLIICCMAELNFLCCPPCQVWLWVHPTSCTNNTVASANLQTISVTVDITSIWKHRARYTFVYFHDLSRYCDSTSRCASNRPFLHLHTHFPGSKVLESYRPMKRSLIIWDERGQGVKLTVSVQRRKKKRPRYATAHNASSCYD